MSFHRLCKFRILCKFHFLCFCQIPPSSTTFYVILRRSMPIPLFVQIPFFVPIPLFVRFLCKFGFLCRFRDKNDVFLLQEDNYPSIYGFGSYPPKFTYEIPSKFCLRFPPIFVPRATKFPSFISLHHKISESESESIKMSDDSDSDFGFGSSSSLLDNDEPSTTTQELVVDGAHG